MAVLSLTAPSAFPISQILLWLVHLLRRHRLQAGINTLLGSVSVGLDFAFIWATKQAIDIATQKTSGQLQHIALILICILASQLIVGFSSKQIKAILGVKAQNHMQQYFFAHLLHGDWSDMNKRHSGDILNRLERDVTDVIHTVTDIIPAIIAVCIRLTGAFFFLFSMDSLLACLSITIIPLFILLSKLYMNKMRALTREVRRTDSKVQSILQEAIQHRMVIQTLEQQPALIQHLSDIHRHLYHQVNTRTRFSSASSTLVSAGFAACYLLVFLWSAYRLQENTITYGMMIAFIQLVGQIQGPFRDITRFIPILVNTFTAGERLMELEQIPEERREKHTLHTPAPGIRFQQVTYAYNPNRLVLHQFSYDFPPGSQTAIVGETGAGKTTLIRLMLALIQPSEGEVLLYDGRQQFKCQAGTRSHFTYVPQGNTLFSGTIRENLLLGNPQATAEQMHEALHDACADFVLNLPLGLDTPCNEQGGGLSEGQAQRIAIARALLRPGGILLLDEASSALDSLTEQRLWLNISRRARNKTLIFITHRDKNITPGIRVLHLDQFKMKEKS